MTVPEQTDKADGGYLPAYRKIADGIGPGARVLELGVYRGASFLLWRELFPDGDITGVDRNVHDGMDTHGCRFILADQADPALPSMVGGDFDLIVDDCSHKGSLTRASFEILWPLVRPGGYYVVEDWMIGLPNFRWHWSYDPEMLVVVKDFVGLLESKSAEVDEIVYRYGMAIIHKRRSNGTVG